MSGSKKYILRKWISKIKSCYPFNIWQNSLQSKLIRGDTENSLYSSIFKKETPIQWKLHIDPHTVIVGDLSTPLLPIHWSARKKSKQRNDGAKWYHKPNEPHNIYTITHTPKNILYSQQIMNFLQNWLLPEIQSNPQQKQESWSNVLPRIWPPVIKLRYQWQTGSW